MRIVQFSSPFPYSNSAEGGYQIIIPKPYNGERLVQLGIEVPQFCPYILDGETNSSLRNIIIRISNNDFLFSIKEILEFDDLMLKSAVSIYIPPTIADYCIITAGYETLENLQKEQ